MFTRKKHLIWLGFIILSGFLLEACEEPIPVEETETLQNITQINEPGFGDDANKYAFATAVYNDELYV